MYGTARTNSIDNTSQSVCISGVDTQNNRWSDLKGGEGHGVRDLVRKRVELQKKDEHEGKKTRNEAHKLTR